MLHFKRGDPMSRSKDIRVELRLRNNLILQLMEEKGIKTIIELCRRTNMPGLKAEVGLIISMRKLPYTLSKEGVMRWRPCVKRISVLFGLPPEMFFSEEQLDAPFERNRAALEVRSTEIRAMIARAEHHALPDALLEINDLRRVLGEQLATLRPRYARVIELRFGLNGEDVHTLKEVGQLIGRARGARVRQIELRALALLRRPKCAQPLIQAGALEHLG